MNRKQWTVLGGIFLLVAFCLILLQFEYFDYDCITNPNEEFNMKLGLQELPLTYVDTFNVVECVAKAEIYLAFTSWGERLMWLLAIICFIMSYLESKKK
ncbi:MAG: hypothetical protein Q8N63_04200 [Nanoarchaeota archaeon]|nr:hypothetical protein [Nanoarchaeota archaeon]